MMVIGRHFDPLLLNVVPFEMWGFNIEQSIRYESNVESLSPQ